MHLRCSLAALQADETGDDLEVILDPVLQLVQQHLLLLRHLGLLPRRFGELAVRPEAVDCRRQQVGIALQEVGVVLGEATRLLTIHLEYAKRTIVAADDDVDRAPDAVPVQHLGAAEALVVLQVLGGDRLAGEQGVAGRRSAVGIDRRVAHHVRLPADAGADQQLVVRWEQLQYLGALHAQALARQHRCPSQQGVEIVGAEGFDAELGKYRFLLLHALDAHGLAGCRSAPPGLLGRFGCFCTTSPTR